MFHKKRKLTQMSGAKPGTDPPQSARSSTLFYPINIRLQILTEDSVKL